MALLGQVSEFTFTGAASPYGACLGPDGNIWVVLRGTGKVAKVTQAGTITEYTVNASAGLYSICAGPDGRLWVTDWGRDKICAVTTSGTVTEYSTTAGAGVFGICSDGTSLWFTEYLLGKVSKITTSGSITRYDPTTAASNPTGIAYGPDGNLWFCEGASNKIGKMSTAGSMVAEYSTAGTPYNICSDGTALWFVQQAGNKVTKISTSGSTTDYTLTASADPRFITYSPSDGCVYFSEYGLNKIGRITAAGSYSEYAPTGTSRPLGVAVDGTGAFTWTSLNATNKIARMDTGVPRLGADSLTWTDGGAPPPRVVPGARTMGTERTVFTAGTIGNPDAHYGFTHLCRYQEYGLRIVSREATSHTSWDGKIVTKTSPDDSGAGWSSKATILDSSTAVIGGPWDGVSGWDWRDPFITRLRNGRVVMTLGQRKVVSGKTVGGPTFLYSDDDGVSWEGPFHVADGMYYGQGTNACATYGADILEKGDGNLLLASYGYKNDGDTRTQIAVSESSNAGTTTGTPTFSNIAYPASDPSYNVVEPQFEKFAVWDYLQMSFHTEDGLPSDCYTITSSNGGSAWSSRVLVTGDSANRQGLSTLADGVSAVLGFAKYSTLDFYYIETGDQGATWTSPVLVSAQTYPLWIMSIALAGTGESQNIGFAYSVELGSQDQASVYYVQASGTDGQFVYGRAVADSLAWTDSAPRTTAVGKTGADSLAWTDGAARATAADRTGSDALTWTDSAARSVIAFERTGADTLTWSDGAIGVRLPVARTGADTLSWTDGAARATAAGRAGADQLAWTDGATGTIAAARTGADQLTWSDSAAAAFTIARDGFDQLTWTDTATMVSAAGRSGADTLTWSDSATGDAGSARTGADTITWTDSAARTLTLTGRTGADQLTWTDGGLRTFGLQRSVFDTLTWTDSGSVGVWYSTGADQLAWTDGGAGSTASVPTAPYTLTGTTRHHATAKGETRSHATAAGSTRHHAQLTGGTTP